MGARPVKRALGMNVADEVNVGRQMRENALAPVGAVAGEDDLVVGIPLGNQLNEFEGQLGSSAMIGIRLGFGGFAPTLLPFGKSLSIAVQPHGDRQGEDFRGCPERLHDDQAEHDPVVSPTDQRLGATGDQGIVVHAGTVKSQSAFPAKSIIDGPKQSGTRGQDGADQFGQEQREGVQVPGGLAEEAMEPTPMPVANIAAGEDDLRHVAMPMRKDPAGDDL